MKRKELSMVLAGLLALGLSACSSTGTSGSGSEMARTSQAGAEKGSAMQQPQQQPQTAGTTGTDDSRASATGTSGTAGTAASGAGMASGLSPAMPGAPNADGPGVVTLIEMMPMSASGSAAGTVAGAAVGGSTGAGTPGARVYRITLHMDDGSTRMITQETAPAFKTGDHVKVANGVIEH